MFCSTLGRENIRSINRPFSCLVTSSVLLARGFTWYWDGGSEISRTTGNTERNIGANGNPGFPMSYPGGQNWLVLKVVEHSSNKFMKFKLPA